jgi:membrane protein
MATGYLKRFRAYKDLLIKAYRAWTEDEASRLGAALSFYTMLSLAPLLVIVVAIAGFIFGREAAQGQLMNQLAGLVGPDGAKAIEAMIAGQEKKAAGAIASILGIVTLIYGATSVVAELRNAMNRILEVPNDKESGIKEIATERSYALGLVLGCGFLLMVSLVVSAALAALGSFAGRYIPAPEVALYLLNAAVSLAMITGIFALLFRYLPDLRLPWRDVLPGAAFTAILFTAGKFLIGLYLGKAGFTSVFGAAGSLVIVLVWVYYSSQLFFFGAEVTQAYSQRSTPAKQEAPVQPEVTPRLRGRAYTRRGTQRSRSFAAIAASIALIGAHLVARSKQAVRSRA